jgi:hypothetical protein
VRVVNASEKKHTVRGQVSVLFLIWDVCTVVIFA